MLILGGLSSEIAMQLLDAIKENIACMTPGKQRAAGRLFICILSAMLCMRQGAAAEEPAALTNIAAIKRLPLEEVKKALPVSVRGVITSFNPRINDAFLQDETGAVYLAADDMMQSLNVGDVVEVQGVTDPGSYAPIVLPRKILASGREKLPTPVAATYASLADGRFDSERVVIEAEVLGIAPTIQDPRLNLMMADGPAIAILVNRSLKELPARIRRATVRLTGVAAPGHNDQRQATSARILVSPQDPIEIIRPGPENPDDLPASAIGSLLHYRMHEGQPLFVRIQGIVTAAPSSEKLFLEDESGAVVVTLGQEESAVIRSSELGQSAIIPGDRIEATGGPYLERLSVLFRADEVKKLGRAELPPALLLNSNQMTNSYYNSRRISFEGRVLAQSRSAVSGRLELTVKSGNAVVVADFPKIVSNQPAAPIGSLVRIKGVLDRRNKTEWNSEVSLVHLASLADLTVLKGPPANPIRLLLIIVVGIIGAGIFAITWVLVLKRQVRTRTAILANINATLLAERRLTAEIIENSDLMICLKDCEGRYQLVNRSFEKTLGRKRDELLGHTTLEMFPGADAEEIVRNTKLVLATGRNHTFEETLTIAGCQRFFASVTFPLRDGDGAITGTCSMKLDVTDRKHLEEQLRQAQKLEAIGQLAGGVAHDFNNILAAILMQLTLLRWNKSIGADVRTCLDDLEKEAKRAASLTRQLLMFSRRAVMDVKLLNLDEVVENLVKMLRRLIGEHIVLEFGIKSKLPLVEADAGMMEQVLMNLAVNARDAMPKGGKITISTTAAEISETEARLFPARRAGHFVCLNVTDTGIGMDEATLTRIFEPFFTTKDPGKGTGLGLATVHGIVAQHKGWIEVTSKVGVGTTFHIFLPASERSQAESAPIPQKPEALDGKETIFVVEDQLKVRQLMALTLRAHGYTVLEAENGQDAMTQWRKHSEQVDLLITDMIMPEGMTGLELVERLRALKPNLKAIISSGYNSEIAQKNDIEKAGILYLPKPYEGHVLAQTVRKCLG